MWPQLEIMVIPTECNPVFGAFHRDPEAVARVAGDTERQTVTLARLEIRPQLCQLPAA